MDASPDRCAGLKVVGTAGEPGVCGCKPSSASHGCSTIAPPANAMPWSNMASSRPPLRLCASPRCRLWFASAHCCSQCGEGLPRGKHTRRCRRHQRFRSQAERQQMTECRIPTCTRLASIGHRTCCSACSPTLGQEHTARCDWLLSQGNVASNSQLPASVVTAWMT